MPVIKTGTSLTTKPTLNLDFAKDKQLDSRITFTRGSTGTYYDGYTSIKAEENLVLYSQQLDNSIYDYSGDRSTITGNDTTAPDNTTTATKVEATADTGSHRLHSNGSEVTVVTSKIYTLSVYLKATNCGYIGVRRIGGDSDAAGNLNIFDCTGSGSIIQTASNGSTSCTITSVGNSWYRCTITGYPQNTTGYIVISYYNSNNALSYTGSGEYMHVWGLQIEERNSVTAYTATTSSRITKYQPALQTAGNNVARFDHNPTTGESLGLLMEEGRSNAALYSEEFDNAAWTKYRVTIESNTIIAPDGTLTADRIVEDTNLNTHLIRQTLQTNTSVTYTMSLYAKAGGQNSRIAIGAVQDDCDVFDLESGSIAKDNSGLASITNVGNGWYRISTRFTSSATTSNFDIRVLTSAAETMGQHQGDGYSGVYIWGAQAESAGYNTYQSSLTSYIKTTNLQTARSKDNANMSASNWFNQNEGTFYANANVTRKDGSPRILSANGNWVAGLMNLIGGQLGVTYNRMSTYDGTNVEAISTKTKIGEYFKGITQYDTTNKYSVIDGSSVTTGSKTIGGTNAITPVTYIDIAKGTGNYDYCGTIKQIIYYPKKLTSSEIQVLTSGDVDELNNSPSLSLQILDSSGNVIKSIYN